MFGALSTKVGSETSHCHSVRSPNCLCSQLADKLLYPVVFYFIFYFIFIKFAPAFFWNLVSGIKFALGLLDLVVFSSLNNPTGPNNWNL